MTFRENEQVPRLFPISVQFSMRSKFRRGLEFGGNPEMKFWDVMTHRMEPNSGVGQDPLLFGVHISTGSDNL